MEYEFIVNDSETYLNDNVNAKLAEGWELYGPPVIGQSESTEHETFLCGQAVILRDARCD